MSASSFLRADGTVEPERSRLWSEWLPSLQQMSNALQLQFETKQLDDTLEFSPDSVRNTTMRQGLGMIGVLALVAGLLPFLVNWFIAARAGTALPMAELALMARNWDTPNGGMGPGAVAAETARMIAGLEPSVFPGWLAAFLSALGEWVQWPLRWWTLWLAYGVGVLVMTRVLAAPRSPTLQRFFALTSYAAVPLVLTALGPIPILGFLANLVAWIWAFVVYLSAVRMATGLETGKAILSILTPGAVLILLGMTVVASAILTMLNVIF